MYRVLVWVRYLLNQVFQVSVVLVFQVILFLVCLVVAIIRLLKRLPPYKAIVKLSSYQAYCHAQRGDRKTLETYSVEDCGRL